MPLALVGCGAGASGTTQGSSTASVPSYVTEAPTHQQVLVNEGARLIVADGCAACHLMAGARRVRAPSFASFAGNDVTLTDGRRVLVDERFLRDALRDPRANELRGYDPVPMLTAVKRLGLAGKPRQVLALAAFIEQIGPEPE